MKVTSQIRSPKARDNLTVFRHPIAIARLLCGPFAKSLLGLRSTD
jgi:hypothetical protein